MGKKPLIGITLDHESKSKSYADYPWFALRENYATSVETFKGMPIMLPYCLDSVKEYAELLDGLIVTGGDFDIPPSYYKGEKQHEKTSPKLNRTTFEFAIAKAILEQNKPVLGICGGQQLLNVIFGGTLLQHIPDEKPSDIKHEQTEPKHLPTHMVNVVANTLLADIMGSREFRVNSTHHQAVLEPGESMVVSAVAPDGIIEAIEHPNYKFCIGVEWHPEYLSTEYDKKLFKHFVESAANSWKK